MKNRQTYAEINLDNIDFNLATIHDECKKPLFCVVKANAYGHGAIEIADYIQTKNYVAYLCVSSIDEAMDLREAGINSPIINLGYTNPQHLDLCIKNEITVSIISLKWLNDAIRFNEDLSMLKFHIKIDSGMNRLGIKDIADFKAIVDIGKSLTLNFEGIFTHYH